MAGGQRRGGRARSAAATRRSAGSSSGGSRSARRSPSGGSGRRTGSDGPEGLPLREWWGLALLVLAALSALGVWLQLAGAVGAFLELAWRGLLGVGGLVVPVALAAAGVVLLLPPRRASPRVVAGAAMALAGLLGLWHLAAGSPGLDAGQSDLHASGGLAGALVVAPLVWLAAASGAAVLLVALALAGVLLATGTSPGRAAAGAAAAGRAVAGRLAALREAAASRGAARTDVAAHDDAVADDVAADGGAGPAEDPPRADEHGAPPAPPPAEPTGGPDDGAAGDGDGPPTPRALAPPQAQDYRLPPMELLRTGRRARGGREREQAQAERLTATLQQFGVDAHVARIERGPRVTRHEIELGQGTKVSAVTRMADDFAYALGTRDLRIVAPVPGKSAIGVEVPNEAADLVTLGDVLRSPEAQASDHPLRVGLGVDVGGSPVTLDLDAMPHLLVAGATGSGKSVTVNATVTSMLMRAAPEQVRMLLIDPKRVELAVYDRVPHLLAPVIADPKRATDALAWVVHEMDQRYERLELLGYRHVVDYNADVAAGTVRRAGVASGESETEWGHLPYVVVVIDELADLMMVAPREVEGAIVRIAQKARAVGIHLVVATQRPSVDVITGLIKANMPSRLALAMATQHDSRTILDAAGAEQLIGHGDMLLQPANVSRPQRIQGCFVSEAEIERVVTHCREQREAAYRDEVLAGRRGDGEAGGQAASLALGGAGERGGGEDDLVERAKDLVVRSGLGSTSMLQRKLKVGFARAGRIMDELEERGVVGPSQGSKAREVLMTPDELDGAGPDAPGADGPPAADPPDEQGAGG